MDTDIILAIDPSYTATGYAIIRKVSQKQQLLHYGFLPLPATLAMPDRIGLFHNFFNTLIIEQKVTTIVLETPFLGKNAQVFLKLGYLRGITHLLAHQHKTKLLEFAPREIKSAVTGFGGAQKDQVAKMVHLLFPGLQIKKNYDVTDAIAIGLCGAHRSGNRLL